MQQEPLLEQLNWFLTSTNWTLSYPNTMVKPLGKLLSNRNPCVVTIETSIPKSNLFRFESFWVQHPGFMELVSEVCNRPVNSSNAATVLCRKFKMLRYELKHWSKNIS